MDRKEKKRVELLAPAGSKAQFFAAVENGADAVYTGGRFLNALQNMAAVATFHLDVPKVEPEIERIANRNARMVEVTDRAAQMDDILTIDFEGFMDGVAFDGGKGDNYSLTLGSHSFIDTFEDQLVGKSIGEEVEVNVSTTPFAPSCLW